MRMKILLMGDDPVAVMADTQLLRDRGLWVFSAFNMLNLPELIEEVKPDVIFFDPHSPNSDITEAYNQLVTDIRYTHIPVVITLSDDDVYLVTRKRTVIKSKRTSIADNIVSAIKLALVSGAEHTYKGSKTKAKSAYNFLASPTHGKINYR